MTALTMILPYQRSSPVHLPRRDLVVSAADCVELRVTVVEADDPSALALELTGGLGGPACHLLVYPDSEHGPRDYGGTQVAPGAVLWAGTGTIADAVGSFDIAVPVGAMAGWPRRCAWSVLLDWGGGGHAEMLAEGFLHVRPTGQRQITPTLMLANPEPDPPVLT